MTEPRPDDSPSGATLLTAADARLVTAAEATMRQALHPSIFNHAMRVRHLAAHLALGQQVDDVALEVASIFHDSGTADENDGEQRFEVEGAGAAARFLEPWGWEPERIRVVWEAIALHTSPGIAERFGPVAQLVRAAVLVDLGRTELPVASTPGLEKLLDQLPRLDIDRVLPDTVATQALRSGSETKAPPFSWPGALVADKLARGQTDTTLGE